MTRVQIYDTTLRDGTQGEGVSFTRDDKIKILKLLDEFVPKLEQTESGEERDKIREAIRAASRYPIAPSLVHTLR